MSLTRRREKPLSELSDKALMRKIADANRSIERVPDRPPHSESATHLGVMEAAGRERKAARQELACREQAAKDAKDAPSGARSKRHRNAGKSVALRALELVARFQHPELADETLVAARLTEDEGRELLKLAARRLEGEQPLTDEELHRYETLVAKTTDDPDIFERGRTERAEQEKRDALQAAQRRHPQAADLLAATAGDPEVLDALRHILRPGAVEVDEFGREIHGKHDARLFELEDVGVLFVLVATIVSNGGDPIDVPESGLLGDGLPPLPRRALGALRKAGYIGNSEVGNGIRVSLGPRCREVAAKWGIELPERPDDASA